MEANSLDFDFVQIDSYLDSNDQIESRSIKECLKSSEKINKSIELCCSNSDLCIELSLDNDYITGDDLSGCELDDEEEEEEPVPAEENESASNCSPYLKCQQKQQQQCLLAASEPLPVFND